MEERLDLKGPDNIVRPEVSGAAGRHPENSYFRPEQLFPGMLKQAQIRH